MKKKVSVIVPVYNEEKNISQIVSEINKTMLETECDYELIFINDGSQDNTLNEIKIQTTEFLNVFYVDFSRKFGKECALKAGIDVSSSDATITIDTDLEYPKDLLVKMISNWNKGYDVIYVKKRRGSATSCFKKITSARLSLLSSFREGQDNISAFMLLDAKVIGEIKRICEDDLYLKEIIKLVGFLQLGISYSFKKKYLESSKYSLNINSKRGIEKIVNIGIASLYVIMGSGLIFCISALIYICYMFIKCFFGYVKFTGWGSLIATTVFFGGVQLFFLGIIGLYLNKVFLQTKKRPNYIIRSTNL